MIDLSYDVRMWAEDYFVLSECTRFTDRRTNRQISTEMTWSNRVRCTLKTGQLASVNRMLRQNESTRLGQKSLTWCADRKSGRLQWSSSHVMLW